ncbi:MAG TPA: GDSL-type esterase/lipase family protein [Phycisphaerae bacterium]|nr:GDSL-type esterase/lipase family protein [Phycisphaerae bacterium]HNU45051.1 GDSL-type esterase/lipase family protein [Phycisphaerae bacterium]
MQAWNKVAKVLLAVVFAVGLAVPVRAADFSVVSAIGDELTDAPGDRGPAYVEYIADLLGVELRNFAVENAYTAEIVEDGQDLAAIDAGSTFVFLWVGYHDIWADVLQLIVDDESFIDEAVANWAALADALQAAGIDVITANLPDLTLLPGANPEGFDMRDLFEQATELFNERLQTAADERGIPVVDIYSLSRQIAEDPVLCGTDIGMAPNYGGPTDFFYDRLVPGKLAQGYFANAFIEVLNEEFDAGLNPLLPSDLGALAGITDCDDCPNDPNKTEPGVCGCGTPDTDTDGDGIPDCNDNCPNTANPDQADANNDGVGDACEAVVPTKFCGRGATAAMVLLLLSLSIVKLVRRR